MLAKVQQPRLQDKGALIGDVTSHCGMGRDVCLKTDKNCLPMGGAAQVFEQTPGDPVTLSKTRTWLVIALRGLLSMSGPGLRGARPTLLSHALLPRNIPYVSQPCPSLPAGFSSSIRPRSEIPKGTGSFLLGEYFIQAMLSPTSPPPTALLVPRQQGSFRAV